MLDTEKNDRDVHESASEPLLTPGEKQALGTEMRAADAPQKADDTGAAASAGVFGLIRWSWNRLSGMFTGVKSSETGAATTQAQSQSTGASTRAGQSVGTASSFPAGPPVGVNRIEFLKFGKEYLKLRSGSHYTDLLLDWCHNHGATGAKNAQDLLAGARVKFSNGAELFFDQKSDKLIVRGWSAEMLGAFKKDVLANINPSAEASVNISGVASAALHSEIIGTRDNKGLFYNKGNIDNNNNKFSRFTSIALYIKEAWNSVKSVVGRSADKDSAIVNTHANVPKSAEGGSAGILTRLNSVEHQARSAVAESSAINVNRDVHRNKVSVTVSPSPSVQQGVSRTGISQTSDAATGAILGSRKSREESETDIKVNSDIHRRTVSVTDSSSPPVQQEVPHTGISQTSDAATGAILGKRKTREESETDIDVPVSKRKVSRTFQERLSLTAVAKATLSDQSQADMVKVEHLQNELSNLVSQYNAQRDDKNPEIKMEVSQNDSSNLIVELHDNSHMAVRVTVNKDSSNPEMLQECHVMAKVDVRDGSLYKLPASIINGLPGEVSAKVTAVGNPYNQFKDMLNKSVNVVQDLNAASVKVDQPHMNKSK